MQKAKHQASRGFTLLELIIVIAILAILSVAVVLVINPAETLARARDSQRLSDLSAVKSAIGLYLIEEATPVLGQGTDNCSNVTQSATVPDVMVSIFGATGTITDDTITAPGGVYAMTDPFTNQTAANASLIDGSGWIPVDLDDAFAMAGGSPLSNWPIDPVNNAAADTSTLAVITTDALMYTYVCDSAANTFELNANLESIRYSTSGDSDKESNDGGDSTALYEIGTDLGLITTW